MGDSGNPFAGPGPEAHFQDGLEAGEFRIQKCGDCAAGIFYPRALCPECGSAKLAWDQATGRGTVYSTSIVRQRPERGPDYNIALVDLEEGPRMMTRVVDIDPEEVKIGMAVEAFVGEIGEDKVVLFRPLGGEAG